MANHSGYFPQWSGYSSYWSRPSSYTTDYVSPTKPEVSRFKISPTKMSPWQPAQSTFQLSPQKTSFWQPGMPNFNTSLNHRSPWKPMTTSLQTSSSATHYASYLQATPSNQMPNHPMGSSLTTSPEIKPRSPTSTNHFNSYYSRIPAYPATTSLQRLHNNPMFQDLQDLLTEECLHMQVPTNLVNTAWADHTTPTLPTPGQDMFSKHIRLQETLLQLRSDEKFRSSGLDIESKYSAEVGQIEVSRYQALHAVGTNYSERQTVNNHFDNKRISLIQRCQAQIDAALSRHTTDILEIPTYPTQAASSFNSTETECRNSAFQPYSNVSERSQPRTPEDVAVPDPNDVTVSSEEFTQPGFSDSGCFSDDSASKTFNSTIDILQQANQTAFTPDLPRIQTADPTYDDVVPSNTNSRKRKTSCDGDDEEDTQESKRQCPAVRMRGRSKQLTDEQTAILSAWYSQHINYPYPAEEDVASLTEATGLNDKQVKKWMSNKRVRSYNTLSITGNQHPIKLKYKAQKQTTKTQQTTAFQQISQEAKQILNEWYDTHISHPYPSDEERSMLATQTGVPESKIKSWFANKRSRSHNTKRQVPNYFIKKFPEYTTHVQMVSISRELTRKTKRQLLDTTLDVTQMCRF
ncbi:hypothetical protein FSP39_005582 [Pinctada imbricata]|uniref:Homeobox domain-containing protein n=1 Tax=Pinctada imbricata TaxID=66713 RepID=A0AA89BW52_PINIB|nr:hypothetical protein FSP39_005582 [Pinctada imbricata]